MSKAAAKGKSPRTLFIAASEMDSKHSLFGHSALSLRSFTSRTYDKYFRTTFLRNTEKTVERQFSFLTLCNLLRLNKLEDRCENQASPFILKKRYSYRSVTIGSTRVARRAGM